MGYMSFREGVYAEEDFTAGDFFAFKEFIEEELEGMEQGGASRSFEGGVDGANIEGDGQVAVFPLFKLQGDFTLPHQSQKLQQNLSHMGTLLKRFRRNHEHLFFAKATPKLAVPTLSKPGFMLHAK